MTNTSLPPDRIQSAYRFPYRDFSSKDTPPFHWQADRWAFTIDGLVASPRVFTYDEIVALPQTSSTRTLVSVDNPTGGGAFYTTTWQGVLLSQLLEEVAIAPTATHALLHRPFHPPLNLDLQLLRHPQTLLALFMGGHQLSPSQGRPTRLLIPGVYDYKMPRWINRIEFTGHHHKDTWEQDGWSPRGIVQTHSTIVVPRNHETVRGPVRIEGIAFAGGRRIAKVEVSVDNRGWMPATLKPGIDPLAALDWFIEWQPPMAGSYQIAVRATDERGFTQYLKHQQPKPDGSGAIHHIVLHVVDSNA